MKKKYSKVQSSTSERVYDYELPDGSNTVMITQVTKLYTSGLTLKQIGQKIGIRESVIRKTLIKAGITMRESHRYTSEERRSEKC